MDVVPAKDTVAGGRAPFGDVDARELLGPRKQPAPEPTERFQILALDGGGAKALFTAHVLARLEEDLGVSITDSFDLIADL